MIVTRILQVLRGSTSPALVETASGADFVLKFAGAGSGPRGLLIEFLALRIADALGAPVPAPTPLLLPTDFPWQIGTDEFDATVQRSAGRNLGIAYVPNARSATAAEVLAGDTTSLSAIAFADRVLQNVDRTAANPNVLIDDAGRLHAIDYDACLYFDRALGARAPFSFALPARHVLAGLDLPSPHAAAPVDVGAIVADAPAAWFAAAGADRETVTKALQSYLNAFVA